MKVYAADTTVPIERSQSEIRMLLIRHQASEFGIMERERSAYVAFKIAGLPIQVRLPLPNPTNEEFTHNSQGQKRSLEAASRVHHQACKARWRALKLVIQAKLEAVEQGISTMEDEFLGAVVVATGETMADRLKPGLAKMIEGGYAPKMLGATNG